MKNIKINHDFTLKEILESIKDAGYDEYMKINNTKVEGYNAMKNKIDEYLDMIK
jgi:hypothetical protein